MRDRLDNQDGMFTFNAAPFNFVYFLSVLAGH